MKDPSFDSDGYPTADTLSAIAAWPWRETDKLVPFVCKAWYYPDRAVHDEAKATLYLSTGGWSGNESIVGALQENRCFWTMYWFKSQCGGHYWFHLKGYKE